MAIVDLEKPIEELPMLPGPMEILDLPDGGSVVIRVEKWELGKTIISPRRYPVVAPKEIRVLRLHLFPGYKEFFPYYYDVTATTLMPQLKPILESPDMQKYEIKITKHGVAPRARFTVEVKKIE